MRLRFHVVDFMSFPLWGDDGRDPLELRAQLPLSSQLRKSLDQICASYNDRTDGEDRSVEWNIELDRQSYKLFTQVVGELEDSVEFIPRTAEFARTLESRD